MTNNQSNSFLLAMFTSQAYIFYFRDSFLIYNSTDVCNIACNCTQFISLATFSTCALKVRLFLRNPINRKTKLRFYYISPSQNNIMVSIKSCSRRSVYTFLSGHLNWSGGFMNGYTKRSLFRY